MLSWHIAGPEEEVSAAVLGSPCGKWSVKWVSSGIWEILSYRPSRKGKQLPDILPIWLEKAWELFWSGEKPGATLCIPRPVPEFTRRVYEVVSEIPFGDRLTYGQVADAAGNPRAARAVGAIMRANPWALFIPCHRVIGYDGSLRGYGGPKGISLKKRILDYEKNLRRLQ